MLLAALLVVCLSATSGQAMLEGYQLIQAIPLDTGHIRSLCRLAKNPGVEFWAEPTRVEQPVLLKTSPEQAELVKQLLSRDNITMRVTIPDLHRHLARQQASVNASSTWDYASYHPVSCIYSHLNQLAKSSRNAKVYSIGKTYEGRPINVIEITDGGNKTAAKDVVLMECGIHAREWISPPVCVYMAEKLISNSTTDSKIQKILNHYDIIIISVINPDGYDYSQQGVRERMWRKNRNPQNGSCIGVDINRNMDVNFNGQRVPESCASLTYPGPSAFSELESQALKKFALSLGSRLKVFLDFQSFTQKWAFPYAYSKVQPANYEELMKLAQIGVNALTQTHGTMYKYGQISKIIYPVDGTTTDWIYINTPAKIAFTIEMRDTGGYGFALPPEQILPTSEETWAGVREALLATL